MIRKSILCLSAFVCLTACTSQPFDEEQTVQSSSNTHIPSVKSQTPSLAATDAQPQRSPEAQLLLDYLRSIYGHKILSGAMANVNWNINEAQWVYKHTGRWPAINCFDFIHHVWSSPGGWIDYSNTSVVEDWHRQGGIVAAMWHWNVPANDGKNYAFYAGSKSDQTNFGVRKIFEPQSSEYALMIKDIDQVKCFRIGYLL